MKIRAPGKLILSGEHAVVYGYPALAMAVDRYIDLDITAQVSPIISFAQANVVGTHDLSFPALQALQRRINQHYQDFLAGTLGVRDILSAPVELAQYALSLLLTEYQPQLTAGFHLQIESSIPLGCGMGSSAALILSIIFGVAQYLQLNVTNEDCYRLGLAAENMQHGRSSGMDLLTSLHGGCIYRHQDTISVRAAPRISMFLVNTGVPQSSTGECVAKAATYFKTSNIGEEFAAVTQELDRQLQANNMLSVQQAVRANQVLLNQIGVVPEKIQHFVKEIEKQGGAAKICGAGAVTGEQAGMVLVVIKDEQVLKLINARFDFSMLPIQCVARGVHVV
jgi:mevalonate kinase